jgi:hypothetical protein
MILSNEHASDIVHVSLSEDTVFGRLLDDPEAWTTVYGM